MTGNVLICRHRDGRVEVTHADPVVRISLGFIAEADGRVIRIIADTIDLAGQATYRITGWDADSHTLIAERTR